MGITFTLLLGNCEITPQRGMEVFLFISKSDCINCRLNTTRVIELLESKRCKYYIVNENCRELEINGLKHDLEVDKSRVKCKTDFGSYLPTGHFKETSVGIYVNKKELFYSNLRNFKELDFLKVLEAQLKRN